MIIGTIIIFILIVICNRRCSKERDIHPVVYIGYIIASFRMALYYTLGPYGGLAGPMIGMTGFVIAMVLDLLTKRDGQKKTFSGKPDITCPHCGQTYYMRSGLLNEYGSMECTNCSNSFIPDYEKMTPMITITCPYCSYNIIIRKSEFKARREMACTNCLKLFRPS